MTARLGRRKLTPQPEVSFLPPAMLRQLEQVLCALLAHPMRIFFFAMILIAAALSEELAVALNLCPSPERMQLKGLRLYRSRHRERMLHFLKTGVGPVRASESLGKALTALAPRQVLGIGYAGALESALRIGELVVVRKALLLQSDRCASDSCEENKATGVWELTLFRELADLAETGGLSVQLGDILTSSSIVGAPDEKRRLNLEFGAVAVDMETAALASVCSSNGIPFGCVRAISDQLDDTFLAPFGHDPRAGAIDRMVRVATAGQWFKRLREWRRKSALARQSLGRFLQLYLA